MEGHFGVGLLLSLAGRVFAENRALGVDAHPTSVNALKDVRKHSLFIHLAGRPAVVQHVSAVGDCDVAQHAHRDYPLFQVESLVVSRNQKGHLLITGRNISGCRNIHK